MKKIISEILALALCLPVVGQTTNAIPLQTIAAEEAEDNTVTVDGLVYELYFNDIVNSAIIIGVADKGMHSVTIPAEVNGCKVTDVLNGVFSECKNLENIYTETTDDDALHSIDGVLFFAKHLIAYPQGRKGSYIVPDGTKKIRSQVFYNANQLTSITLPESLEVIDPRAFSFCTALEEVIGTVPCGNGNIFQNCSSLKYLAFAEADPKKPDSSVLYDLNLTGCASLETLVIPESITVESINLTGCSSLNNLTIADMSENCMITIASCNSLQSLKLPDVNSIVISECARLKQIYANDAITFSATDCPELEFISLGSNERIKVTNCPNLERLSVYRSGSISIGNCPDLTTIHIFKDSRFTMLQNADKLTVYGTEMFKYTKQDCDESGVPFALMETNTGDANDDGKFNIVDIIMLQNYLLNTGRLTYWKNCDFNGDNEVDVFDLALMKKALLSGE